MKLSKKSYLSLTREDKLKECRKIIRELGLTMSTIYKGKGIDSKIKNAAWTTFSACIRRRDFKKRNGKCYTCNTYGMFWQDLQAGHYISRGSAYTLYNEINVQAQCSACNSPAIGNGRPKTFSYELNREYGVGTSDKLYEASKLYQKNDFEWHYSICIRYADTLRKSQI